MVYCEDEGVSLKESPVKIYQYLYATNPSEPLITIADVTKDLPPGYDVSILSPFEFVMLFDFLSN